MNKKVLFALILSFLAVSVGITGLLYSAMQHKHDIVVDEAVEPTCSATGLTEGSHCKGCDEMTVKQEVIAKLPHTEQTDAAVEPTCSKTGLTEGKSCSVCNEIIVAQKTVAKLPHTEVVDAAVAATCSSTGLTEGKHCSVCNETIVAQTVVAKLPHDEVIDKAVAATCKATGLTEGKHCTKCDYKVAQTVVAKLAHTPVVDKAVAATCKATGLTEGKHCSVCNETIVAQTVVAKLAHTEVVDKALAPTCTVDGKTEGKHCSACNDVLVAQTVVPATGHTEETLSAKAATCESTGLTEGKKCSVCGTVLVAQTEIAKIDHTVSFGEMLNYYVSIKDTDAGNSLVSGETKEELLGHYDGLMYFKGKMDEYITYNEFYNFALSFDPGVNPNTYCLNIFRDTEKKNIDGEEKAKLIDLLITTSGTRVMNMNAFSSLQVEIKKNIYVYEKINEACSYTEFLARINDLVERLADHNDPDYAPFEVGANDPEKQEAAKNLYIMYYNTKCPLDHEGKLD